MVYRYSAGNPLHPEALKEKQRALRDGFSTPLTLRVHRALSWLRRAEAEQEGQDVRFILLWIDRLPLKPRYTDVTEYPLGLCFKIGLFQCLAMIPGTSRSGATIAANLQRDHNLGESVPWSGAGARL